MRICDSPRDTIRIVVDAAVMRHDNQRPSLTSSHRTEQLDHVLSGDVIQRIGRFIAHNQMSVPIRKAMNTERPKFMTMLVSVMKYRNVSR
jgi:hypothetical protein